MSSASPDINGDAGIKLKRKEVYKVFTPFQNKEKAGSSL
jgi:hypothetical protein